LLFKIVESDSEYSNSDIYSKRQRTTFTMLQTKCLQKFFDNNPNPDGSELEAIAERAGLKSVTPAWIDLA